MTTSASKRTSARHHAQVRRQHEREIAQDYVEAIAETGGQGHPVRVTDLQKVFGVSHVTVIRTLKRLEEADLCFREESGAVALTGEGKEMARRSAERHRLIRDLLLHIGAPEAAAEADAEGMEHHLSPETMKALRAFLVRCNCGPSPFQQ